MAENNLPSAPTPNKPFNFFGLPRELRNRIYRKMLLPNYSSSKPLDNLPGSHGELDPDSTPLFNFVSQVIEMQRANTTTKNLLLVNHQFKEEVEEEAQSSKKLIISNHPYCGCTADSVLMAEDYKVKHMELIWQIANYMNWDYCLNSQHPDSEDAIKAFLCDWVARHLSRTDDGLQSFVVKLLPTDYCLFYHSEARKHMRETITTHLSKLEIPSSLKKFEVQVLDDNFISVVDILRWSRPDGKFHIVNLKPQAD